jgi:hypothetical protein
MKPRTAAFDTLVDTMSAQRQVVEYLLFKLVTLKLLFVAEERRFLEKATNEVERVVDSLRQAEGHRDTALRAVAAEWDTPIDELTLRRLAEETDGETSIVVSQLRDAFRTLAGEIETLLGENRFGYPCGAVRAGHRREQHRERLDAGLYTATCGSQDAATVEDHPRRDRDGGQRRRDLTPARVLPGCACALDRRDGRVLGRWRGPADTDRAGAG